MPRSCCTRRPVRIAVSPSLAALTLVGALVLGALFGSDELYAWIGTPERHLGVLAWMLALLAFVVGQSLEDGDRRFVGTGLVVAGVGLGLAGVGEAAGWEPAVFDVDDRLSGTLGSPAYLGAATALVLPALIGVTLDRSWSGWLRATAGAAAAGSTVALVGSGARAAWVGLAVAAVLCAWAQRRRINSRRRAATLVAGAGAAVLGLLVVVGPSGERIASAFESGEPGGRGRLDEWRVAAHVIVEHPLVGVGPEGYRIAFREGVDERYQQAHGRDPLPDRAHSTPLDLLLAGGVFALVAWLALVLLVGRAVLVVMRGDRLWLVGVAAGLVAHFVGGLFLFPIAELEPVVWLLAGLVLAASPSFVDSPSPQRSLAVHRTLPVLLGLLAVVAFVAGVLDMAADRQAARAADSLAEGDTGAAVDAAANAARLRSDVVRLHLLEARARVADEQGTITGLAAVSDALSVSPADPIARRVGPVARRARGGHPRPRSHRRGPSRGRALARARSPRRHLVGLRRRQRRAGRRQRRCPPGHRTRRGTGSRGLRCEQSEQRRTTARAPPLPRPHGWGRSPRDANGT